MSSRILYTPGEQKKRRMAARRFLIFFLLTALIGACVCAVVSLLRAPAWQISAVDIHGLRTVAEERMRGQIASALEGGILFFIPRSSAMVVSAAGIEARIRSAFPQVASVSVRKHMPNRLGVSVVERDFWGVLCNDNDPEPSASSTCVMIDATGYAYASAPFVQGTLISRISTDGPDPYVGAPAVAHDLMGRLDELRRVLTASLDGVPLVFSLSLGLPSEIRVIMSQGYTLMFKRSDDFAVAVGVLKQVLDGEIRERVPELEYADLRFGNKVFYKLRE